MTQDSTESSVLFSLVDLQRMERDRITEEESERARARERRDRERHEAEASRNRLEQQRLAREQAIAAEQARRELEATARERAREQAAAEVARIEAQAKLRLVADEQARKHELALLRTRADSSLYRMCLGLVATLGVVILTGAVGYWQLSSKLDHAQQASLLAQRERDSLQRDVDRISGARAHEREASEARLNEMRRTLTSYEAQLRNLALRSPPTHNGASPPPVEIHPPAVPCKDGDPLCDASQQPR